MDLGALAGNLGLPVALVVYLLWSRRQDDERRDKEMADLRAEVRQLHADNAFMADRYITAYIEVSDRVESAIRALTRRLDEGTKKHSPPGPAQEDRIRPDPYRPSKASDATTIRVLPRTPLPLNKDMPHG
jgi:hypothetical protein